MQSSRRRLLIPATQPAPAARDDDAVVAAGGALSDHRAFQADSCYSCRASCLPPPIARPTGVLACACTALKVRAPVLALVAVVGSLGQIWPRILRARSRTYSQLHVHVLMDVLYCPRSQ